MTSGPNRDIKTPRVWVAQSPLALNCQPQRNQACCDGNEGDPAFSACVEAATVLCGPECWVLLIYFQRHAFPIINNETLGYLQRSCSVSGTTLNALAVSSYKMICLFK